MGFWRRKRAPAIAIAHGNVASGDAIGNDILGMYRLFSGMGAETCVLAESFEEGLGAHLKTTELPADGRVTADVLIYHHSIYWEQGEQLLDRFGGQVVFRYHSITPPSFFEPYSPLLTRLCADGIKQTGRLIKRFNRSLWLADSEFNRSELITKGANPDRVFVVSPFNMTEQFLSEPNESHLPVRVLFVGRFAPNKGHRELVRIVHSYVSLFGNDIELNVVGPINMVDLGGYVQEVQDLIDDLGLRNHVRITPAVPFEALKELFRNSSVFLCCSRHEGFCLPAIEAQAAGLPVVGVNAGALAETLGRRQIVCEVPRSAEDYRFFALVIRELASNAELREVLIRNGYRNLLARFTNEVIENALITHLLPIFRDFQ
jgi:glycosyltransferase involved in cell wall biosynthesis